MFFKHREKKSKFEEILFAGHSSLINYQDALKSLMTISSPLVEDLEQKALELINFLIQEINLSKELFLEDQLTKLNKIYDSINWSFPNLRSRCALQLSKKYLLLSMESFDLKNYVNAVTNCEHSLEFARKGLEYSKQMKYLLLEELNSQLESANFLLIRSKSYRILEKASKYFDDKFFNQEELDFEAVKDSLDIFREALLISKCIENETKADIELEAILCSKIGEISYIILKDREKAENYVKMSVRLGMSLHPKNVHQEIWYRKAFEIVEEINKLKEAEERKRMEEYKQKYKEEVYDKLKELEEKDNEYGPKKLLIYVLEKFPPEENFVFNVEEEVNKYEAGTGLKKVFIKIIAKYHPDKHSEIEKKILMEEIAKILNRKYEIFK